MPMQPEYSLLRPLEVHPRLGGERLHHSCCSWGKVVKELQEGVGTGIENVLWVSLGLMSLTSRVSYTMHRLEQHEPRDS